MLRKLIFTLVILSIFFVPTYANNTYQNYMNSGEEKWKLGQYAEAIKDYDKAIELDPNSVRAFFARGYMKSSLGLYIEAFK